MKADGIENAIAFTQYPQYSCSTTGSSLNDLYRTIKKLNMENTINWKIIDRWPTHQGFIKTVCKLIARKLKEFEDPSKAMILFSAHSLPMSVVNRGDNYPSEVAYSVQEVMQHLEAKNPFRIVWQSKVGPLPWLGPETKEAVEGLCKHGIKDILIVPIAFTSDHIETLYELDIQYIKEFNANGMNVKRTDSLNVEPDFIDSLADIVMKAFSSEQSHSHQFPRRCSQCINQTCGEMRHFFLSK